ncbi:MAG: glycerol kinase GlpK [Clostridiales bacterium]|nr:glycerol kinase GlpK [Clostridiales bacterium]
MGKYLMALDQGTTSSRCILFDLCGQIAAVAQQEFTQIFPREGWVEHDAGEILDTQIQVSKKAMEKVGAVASDIIAIGITNQRETTVVWDRDTGRPIYNAIVWQCRRTADYCRDLKKAGYTDMIQKKTGLLIDSYFSATKIKWILDNVPGARERAKAGKLLFGTIDCWLIYNLTGGRVHATDYSNAARTMLFNINTLDWDHELLELFDIPASMMPAALPSAGLFGYTSPELFGGSIAISGVAGDQQAALFGQCCFEPGSVKNTYGTGGFLLMNTGTGPVISKDGLLASVAWGIGNEVNYVLEGSVFICGAAVQWLRDGLGVIEKSSQSEVAAKAVPDTGGVYVVPAFVGLGAPYWDPYARGAILGITRATTKNHIIRAVLESMAYQTADVLGVMEKEAGFPITSLKVDGGASANNLLLQFQSDILNLPIIRPRCIETTALGAANLAGLAAGAYSSLEEIQERWQVDRGFSPSMSTGVREEKLRGWRRAVERARGWVES